METTTTVTLTDITLSTEDIQKRIAQLSVTEEGEPLQNAMQELKKALLANKAACAVLLPKDIGDMVAALNKMTGKHIEEAMKEKGPKKKVKFDYSDPSLLQEIEDNLL